MGGEGRAMRMEDKERGEDDRGGKWRREEGRGRAGPFSKFLDPPLIHGSKWRPYRWYGW